LSTVLRQREIGVFEVVPEGEMPAMLAAIKDGRCCSCYGPILPAHSDGGLYCCGCDDGCGPTCPKADE
jgi:hypothetical protein